MKTRSWQLAGMAVVTTVALAACSNGGGGSQPSSAPINSQITADGEGVSLNEAGGQALKLGEPVKGGSLRIGMLAPVEHLDVASAQSSAGAEVVRFVHDTLLRLDRDGNVVPELAKSMETTDGGLNWTMKLPTGVKFHDGTPFNAAAVVANMDRIKAPASKSPAASDVRRIVAYTAVDDETVTFKLAAPLMTFPKLFAPVGTASAAYVPSPTAVKALGDGYGKAPVGVGPFMVESFKPGGDIVLKANPNYRIAGLPYLDKLTFVTATDSQSRLAAVEAGNLDIAITQVSTDFAKAKSAGLKVLRQPATTYYNLLFNLSKAPFDDIRFRKAVIQGIDLNGMNKAVFQGLQTPMTGIFPPDHPFFKETGWPGYDPEAAKKLVQEYTAATGKPAQFTLVTTSPPEFQKQAQIMQQMLKDVGITMDIKVSDQPTMITEALAGNYQAQHRYAAVAAETFRTLDLSFRTGLPTNISRVGNPKLDALLDQAKVATPEQRPALMAEVQQELTNWLPYMPQIQHALAYVVGDKVGGFPGSIPGNQSFDARYLFARSAG